MACSPGSRAVILELIREQRGAGNDWSRAPLALTRIQAVLLPHRQPAVAQRHSGEQFRGEAGLLGVSGSPSTEEGHSWALLPNTPREPSQRLPKGLSKSGIRTDVSGHHVQFPLWPAGMSWAERAPANTTPGQQTEQERGSPPESRNTSDVRLWLRRDSFHAKPCAIQNQPSRPSFWSLPGIISTSPGENPPPVFSFQLAPIHSCSECPTGFF